MLYEHSLDEACHEVHFKTKNVFGKNLNEQISSHIHTYITEWPRKTWILRITGFPFSNSKLNLFSFPIPKPKLTLNASVDIVCLSKSE